MTLKIHNPFNQEVIAELSYDTDTRIGDKIDAARRTFEKWRWVPLVERIGYVKESLDYFRANKAVIAEEISRQMGKPINQSRNEFGGFLKERSTCWTSRPTLWLPEFYLTRLAFTAG